MTNKIVWATLAFPRSFLKSTSQPQCSAWWYYSLYSELLNVRTKIQEDHHLFTHENVSHLISLNISDRLLTLLRILSNCFPATESHSIFLLYFICQNFLTQVEDSVHHPIKTLIVHASCNFNMLVAFQPNPWPTKAFVCAIVESISTGGLVSCLAPCAGVSHRYCLIQHPI